MLHRELRLPIIYTIIVTSFFDINSFFFKSKKISILIGATRYIVKKFFMCSLSPNLMIKSFKVHHTICLQKNSDFISDPDPEIEIKRFF